MFFNWVQEREAVEGQVIHPVLRKLYLASSRSITSHLLFLLIPPIDSDPALYTSAMSGGSSDPRMTTIHPRIRYNTIGGVNGPLVILENVRSSLIYTRRSGAHQVILRSNSQNLTRLYLLHYQMAPRDQDRCWKREVGSTSSEANRLSYI